MNIADYYPGARVSLPGGRTGRIMVSPSEEHAETAMILADDARSRSEYTYEYLDNLTLIEPLAVGDRVLVIHGAHDGPHGDTSPVHSMWNRVGRVTEYRGVTARVVLDDGTADYEWTIGTPFLTPAPETAPGDLAWGTVVVISPEVLRHGGTDARVVDGPNAAGWYGVTVPEGDGSATMAIQREHLAPLPHGVATNAYLRPRNGERGWHFDHGYVAVLLCDTAADRALVLPLDADTVAEAAWVPWHMLFGLRPEGSTR